ncbi:MAG: hypothetical protein DME24_18735 [Verrucomicrobia bacterium]|nr:MAG: hypothetical protein DME24_18735 [Verrucomicrobiota bacterium]
MADRLLQGFIRKFMPASTPFDPAPRPPFNDRQDGRFESGGKAGTERGSALIWGITYIVTPNHQRTASIKASAGLSTWEQIHAQLCVGFKQLFVGTKRQCQLLRKKLQLRCLVLYNCAKILHLHCLIWIHSVVIRGLLVCWHNLLNKKRKNKTEANKLRLKT